jgi:hypothetical protein
MTHQYWCHIQCYPLNSSIEVEIAQGELLRQLSIMRLDVATSPTASTSDFPEEQCERYQSMLLSKLCHSLFTRANMDTRLSCQLQDMDGSSFDDANKYAANNCQTYQLILSSALAVYKPVWTSISPLSSPPCIRSRRYTDIGPGCYHFRAGYYCTIAVRLCHRRRIANTGTA